MAFVNKYLNLQYKNDILVKLNANISTYSNLISYNEYFIKYIIDQNLINEYINLQLNEYVDKNYSLINVMNVDINCYIEKINLFVEKKFKDIIKKINLSHIISICDYFAKNKSQDNTITNHYIYWRNKYYKMIFDTILCGKYKIYNSTDKKNLISLLEENSNKIMVIL